MVKINTQLYIYWHYYATRTLAFTDAQTWDPESFAIAACGVYMFWHNIKVPQNGQNKFDHLYTIIQFIRSQYCLEENSL